MRNASLWHPILVFLAATSAASVVLILLQALLGIDYRYAAMTQLGPAIGLFFTWYFYGSENREVLPRPSLSLRGFGVRLAAVVLLVSAYVGLTWLLSVLLGVQQAKAGFNLAMLIVFLAAQLIGAVGEEVGWRGFLQPSLERVWHPLPAAIATGGIWALWHVQVLANPLFFIAFAGVCILVSLFLGRIALGAWWQRGILAGLVHWAINVGIVLVADVERVVNSDLVHRLPLLLPQVVLGIVGAVWIAVLMRRKKE